MKKFSFIFLVVLTACNLNDLQALQQVNGAQVAASPAPAENESDPNRAPPAPQQNPPPSHGLVSAYSNLSDAELFDMLVKNGIGQCYIFDARVACPNCFCDYYFKSNLVPWAGKGWPMNPDSKNSTGCISAMQWGGYTPDMATADFIHNGAAQARHALSDPSNPCGIDQVEEQP